MNDTQRHVAEKAIARRHLDLIGERTSTRAAYNNAVEARDEAQKRMNAASLRLAQIDKELYELERPL